MALRANSSSELIWRTMVGSKRNSSWAFLQTGRRGSNQAGYLHGSRTRFDLKNTVGGQPRFQNTIPCPKQFRKKLYVSESRQAGPLECKKRCDRHGLFAGARG